MYNVWMQGNDDPKVPTEAEKQKIYRKRYREKNRDRIKATRDAWRAKNRDKLRAQRDAWRAANMDRIRQKAKEWISANKESYLESKREYRKKNRERIVENERRYEEKRRQRDPDRSSRYGRKNRPRLREKDRHRYKNDPVFCTKKRIRARLQACLRRGMAGKKWGATMALTGCTTEQLMAHIESQFTEGMGWHNRSRWHIDHIVPCASFDLTGEEGQKACFHYTNLRPLWAAENMKKGAKIPG